MNKFAELIIKGRKVIIIATIAIVILSMLGLIYFVYDKRINSDMLEYLPEDTSTARGIEFLKQNFGVKGDAFIVVEGDNEDIELEKSINRLKQTEGLSQFLWVGDVENMQQFADILDSPIFKGFDVSVDITQLTNYLKQPINSEDPDTKYNYVILMLFDYSPSTQEAFDVLDIVYNEFSGRSVAISGMTATAKQIMADTIGELKYYIIFSVIVVILILLLATSSYFEPFILIVTLLISVLVNMGTNIIFPSVSIISFAASGVLQLGIAMDYAIFFMHTYKGERQKYNSHIAAKKTIPKVMITIIASSLTTIGGFAALCFMDFKIGIDLAQVIIKGILLSLLTVIFLQPALVVVFDKCLKRTAHKAINIKFEKVSSFTIKWRGIIIALAALMIIPSYFMQSNVPFSYLKIYEEPQSVSPQQKRAIELGNQVITAVPLHTKTGGHKDYINELMLDEKITNVVGAYSALDIDENKLERILNLLIGDNRQTTKELQALSTLFQKVDGEWYTLYLIEIKGETEDKQAFATHKYLIDITNKYFDENYPLGILTGVNDMAEVTPRDFLRVTFVSAGIILIIMALLLKSLRKSLVMVLLIELAIWINISLNFIFSTTMNFMVYIIISSVQLGCTVDYAILMSTKFEEAKIEYPDAKVAATKASAAAFPAITTSAGIIIGTCMTIVLISENLLVKEMSWVLARGAFISYLLVVTVLPGLLVFFKKFNTTNDKIEKVLNKITHKQK